ncbi:hypothetical protein [Streptomyces sp. NBC_00076]|uniref:hypothetical protein n=1 Tax=Streptomyces sp. NBC_00076 TaxID=2975642 RepID=UPI003245D6D2
MNYPYPTEIADLPSATLTAICRTRGCPAEGLPFEGTYFENPAPPMYRGQCGRCGQPITDLRTSNGALLG